MSQVARDEKQQQGFIKSILKTFLLAYVFFSLARFYLYDEFILSKHPTVIVIAFVIALLARGYEKVKVMVNVDTNKKLYRYVLRPVQTVILAYVFIMLVRHAILMDSIVSYNMEVAIFAIMLGIIESVRAKVDDVSPRNPDKEPSKPLSYYIDKYIIHATPFHKVMFIVYGLCIFMLLLFLLISK